MSRYTCTCRIPFSGINCEINSNPQCTSTTCLNGGTCSISNGNVFCSCPFGFGGTNCQTYLLTTTLAPTTTNSFSTCVDKGSFCPGIVSLCNSGLTVGGTEPLRTYCAISCGVCSTTVIIPTTTTASVTCIDKGSFCPSVTNLCNSGLTVSGTEPLRTYCSRSCGVCSGGGGSPITSTPVATTIATTTVPPTCVDSQPSCPSFANSCSVFLNSVMRIRDVCRRTCNNC